MNVLERLITASSKTHNLSLVRGALLGPMVILPVAFMLAILSYLFEPSSNESLVKVLAGTFISSGFVMLYTYPIVLSYGVVAFWLLKRFYSVDLFSVLIASALPGMLLIIFSDHVTQFNWVVLLISILVGVSCFLFSIYTAANPTLPILKGIVLDDSFVLGWQEEADKVVFEVELSIWPESEFYTKPKDDEYTSYKRAHLVFSNIKKKNSLYNQEDVTPFTDAESEKDYGNIEYFDTDGQNFKLYGAFGDVEIKGADFEIKWR